MDALGIGLPPVLIDRPADRRQQRRAGDPAALCLRKLSVADPWAGDRLDRRFTKAGGLAAQALSVAALVPPLGVVAALILAPVLLGLALTLAFCPETRGVDLRLVDARA